MNNTEPIAKAGLRKEKLKTRNDRKGTYKNRVRIQIAGRTVEVEVEALAKAIATNQADWQAYTGRAERVARALPEILKCAVLTRRR